MKFSLAALAASLALAGCASGPMMGMGAGHHAAGTSRAEQAGTASAVGTSGTTARSPMALRSQAGAETSQPRGELLDRMTIEREVERSPGP